MVGDAKIDALKCFYEMKSRENVFLRCGLSQNKTHVEENTVLLSLETGSGDAGRCRLPDGNRKQMYDYKVLIIDDNEAVLRSLKFVLNGVFRSVVAMPDPKVLPALLAAGDVDVVLLDMNFDARRLDGEDGLFWLARIKEQPNAPAVVLITAFGDVDLAVKSIKNGAEDFITKPWDNEALIAKLVDAIVRQREKMQLDDVVRQAQNLKDKLDSTRRMTVEEVGNQHILEVLKEVGGNYTLAAKRLGIGRQTLYNKVRKIEQS